MTLRVRAEAWRLLAREHLTGSKLYPWVRRLRTAPAQERDFEELLRRIATLPASLNIAHEVEHQLRGRRTMRRSLPPRLSEATVVSVGAYGWEQFGLWPSLKRASGNHHHFSDGLGIGQPFYCTTSAERSQRCARLLDLVLETARRSPVDVVFIYADPSNLNAELFERLHGLGCWTVLMGLDDRHTFASFRRGELDTGVESIAAMPDLYWTTWRAGALLHHAIGARPWVGGLGADPTFHHPVVVERDIPVLFLGQRYGVRRELVEKLRDLRIPVVARGYGWEGDFLGFEDTVSLMSRAEVVLGMSNVGAMEGVSILKGRDFEAPMCGACYLTQWSPELGEFFEVGKDVAAYGSITQAAEETLALSRDPMRREEMRRRALDVSLRRHTWETRFREMYTILKGSP